MSVGKGPVVGVQEVTSLNWVGSMPHTINEVGFASGTGFTAAWQMEENLGTALCHHRRVRFLYLQSCQVEVVEFLESFP